MHFREAAVVVVTIAASLGAGLGLTPAAARGAAPTVSSAAAAGPHIDWHDCRPHGLSAAGARCGELSVPLDHSRPNGRQLTLAVARVRHTSSAADYQGVIVVNPGGPGAPGRDLAALGSSVPGDAGDSYDWVGFDPRGVGASRPRLSCVPHYFHLDRPDYRPVDRATVRAWKQRSAHYADACASKHPRLIRHMTTADTARDMNILRRALGVPRISYYGFSYGTYLGEVFATLFPDRLGRMVLDSTVDPARVWYRANLDQDRPFDRNLDLWFGWIARYSDHYHLGSTTRAVRKHWYDALDALAQQSAGGKLGPAEWTDAFLWAGYYRDTWPGLARAFAHFVHADRWRPVIDVYRVFNDTTDDNGYAAYLAVECTDAAWPHRWKRWRSDSTRIAADAPFLTWDNTWFNAPCRTWGAPSRQPVDVTGDGVGSVLMIDETLDAATPYDGSVAVRQLFRHASLIAVTGGMTHAGSLSGNDCVDHRIARYLATGHRPPRQDGDGPDYRCRPSADPTPSD